MRDGIRPNTSVGRFLRLYLRNVAGFLHGTATGDLRQHLARRHRREPGRVKRIGWEPHAVGRDSRPATTHVMISRYTGRTSSRASPARHARK
jgi:hypothetical protein